MFQAIIGQSEDPLTEEAVREVIGQIRSELPEGMQPQAGILFCSEDLDHAVILSQLHAQFPAMELIGCTTDGELSSKLGFTDDSLILTVFISDKVEIRAGVGKNAASGGETAGREAASSAHSRLQRQSGHEKFAIILTDPFNAGVSDVDKGIQSVLGKTFPIFGGAAAAHSKKRQTFQFCQGEIFTESVAMLLFAGPVAYSCGIKGGHSPLGAKEPVTQVNGNILYRIGEQRAFDYFQHYIGEYDLFMNYCLAVFPEGDEHYYVRSAPASDPEIGSVTLNGKVNEGAMVQIGMADKTTLIKSCQISLRQAQDAFPGKNIAVALLFSCAGRKMSMGTQIAKETQEVQTHLPNTPFAGFYCYGEFGPLQPGEPYLFHGTTFVTVLIGESEEA